jgi:CheY-like chemotaxis protein
MAGLYARLRQNGFLPFCDASALVYYFAVMPGPATILAVDDNEAHRYFVCRTLEQAGFQAVAVGDGASALEKAQERPDLVLLDANLPDMTGFEVCRRLKANPATTKIPVVMFSAISQSGSAVNDAMQLGASGFLFFPMSAEQLVAVVSGSLSPSRK